MKHLIVITVLIALIVIYMLYKVLEKLVNYIMLSHDVKLHYQLDLFKIKRILLTKIPI